MKRMPRQLIQTALVVSLATPAIALAGPLPEVQHSAQGIAYISGGVGDEEASAIRAAAGDYNVRLLLTGKQGQYLANAHIQVLDAKGKPVVDATADGPYFYMKLKPGKYQLVATLDERPQQRMLQVAKQGSRSVHLTW
ncbi:hypothetical protein [Jeongeupia sp. USM3]|uniref:hypothetical protein n=1 Tax=Jeongeupia sp. USM3 TaxID=1906741 RepID=UPI00089DF1B0|nr:hypothetical protein [Jeongeupia sp. USM3]AOX99725.1 hypothetical protein BJP62_04195 [Jeongeupia sp. USM3]